MYNLADGTYSDPEEERRKEGFSARAKMEAPVAASDFVGDLQETSVGNGKNFVNGSIV